MNLRDRVIQINIPQSPGLLRQVLRGHRRIAWGKRSFKKKIKIKEPLHPTISFK